MGSMMSFVLNSILLGVGLAMDAFSVSIANGLNEPGMSRKKTYGIAACYAFFQFAMPMIGWFCVHTIASYFKVFQKFIPWIALLLLLYIGGQMLFEGIRRIKNKC
ncbi:MAG: manganese efflux pump, partial [Lachnospiraceae bacterium]|nr:manganese efflux pump [Lachnospiraceae bacterium]